MTFFDEYKKPRRGKAQALRPVDIGTLLRRFLASNNLSQVLDLKTLRQSFAGIVGEHVARHVSVVDLSGGTLVLKASSGVWRAELNAQKKAIIAECNSVLKSRAVKNIRFE